MTYLLKINGHFYYNRRVPEILKKHDSRSFVRLALNTDSHKEALKLAIVQNEQVESYWKSLVQAEGKHSEKAYNAIIRNTRLSTFGNSTNFIGIPSRIEQGNPLAVAKNEISASPVLLDEAFNLFLGFAKDKIINKSTNQIRKWKNPRLKAINNFIHCIGNKSITAIVRSDILQFRDWWLNRIQEENLVENSANKNFIHLKTILESVSDNLKLNLDIKHLFNKLLLAENYDSEKLPFDSAYIISTLLNPENLSGLGIQARCVLNVMSETGAGLTELVSLSPNDIILDSDIPHIIITPRQKNGLKTKYRKRIIPLVGYALNAFNECPNGFPDYHDRPDSLSSVLNKYLRENKLFPSENHTGNSLRHSFQDRLLAANAPDRVQADLMGHKFSRPMYGEGATLHLKHEWLKKIQLKPETALQEI